MMYPNLLGREPYDTLDLNGISIKPLWVLPDLYDEEDLLKWCNDTVDGCVQYYGRIFVTQQYNMRLYQGLHWAQIDRYSNQWNDRAVSTQRKAPRVVVNHLYDFTEQWVSKFTRYRPAVAIYPATAEEQKTEDAKIAKDVLDYIWYVNNIDKINQQFVRHCKIFGESYLWITWDPNKGDIHPDWLDAQRQGYRVPVLDKDGQPVKSADGKELLIQKAVRIGDVKYEVTPPWHVFDMPCRSRDLIDWSIKRSAVSVDYLKAKYPDKADKIKADDTGTGTTYNALYSYDIGQLQGETIVYELFHRSTEFLDKGRYIKFTKTAILENTELPYSHGKLPYLYLSDIEVPDTIRGMSFYQQLFPLQHQINACASLIYKAFVLMAHPKIVAREGSVDINQLLNDSTVIMHDGNAPSMMSMSPISSEVFGYMDKLEMLLEKLSGIFTMSRGQAPSGVRAAKALRVLEEQEDKRAFGMAVKYNEIALVENARQSLSVMGTFADDSDGRMARILGKDNEYRTRKFKAASLAKPYDVRIENSTALSQSPAARIEELTELAQVRLDPDAPITRGQFINFLDMTADEQFKDIATRASKCAMSENDDMASGLPVALPTQDEDLITHWQIHVQDVQGRDFKERRDATRRNALIEHIYNTEYWMFKKAYGITDAMGQPVTMPNVAFQQQLMATCPNFPVYFQMPTPTLAPPMGPGAMNMPAPQELPPEAAGPVPSPVDTGVPLEQGANTAPPPMTLAQQPME